MLATVTLSSVGIPDGVICWMGLFAQSYATSRAVLIIECNFVLVDVHREQTGALGTEKIHAARRLSCTHQHLELKSAVSDNFIQHDSSTSVLRWVRLSRTFKQSKRLTERRYEYRAGPAVLAVNIINLIHVSVHCPWPVPSHRSCARITLRHAELI